jgi:uncharacterized radical SAM superfamily protein
MTSGSGTLVSRERLESVKIALLARGVRVTPENLGRLKGPDNEPLSVHEYPTTAGLTLELPDDVYVNAPFDEWYCAEATVSLEFRDGAPVLTETGHPDVPVLRVLPLPGYLAATDSQGLTVTDVAMSHTDRVRLSPLAGCAYTCDFCDFHLQPYHLHDQRRLIEALEVAISDSRLPVRHMLISGGSPRKAHYDQFLQVVGDVVEYAVNRGVETDIMMSPTVGDTQMLDELVRRGATGFSINLELFSDAAALAHLGKKYRATREYLGPFISRAVELVGGAGAVRSLIIPGLESDDAILEGVDWLASLGCWPVLSPFRPAQGTPVQETPPPSPAQLAALLTEARRIVAGRGLGLGPTCSPCQHNTLAFPWDVPAKEKTA